MNSAALRLPEMNLSEVKVQSLHVRVGQHVLRGDAVITVESDKATLEIPCPFSARISEVVVNEGQLVRPGDALVHLRPDPLSQAELRGELETSTIHYSEAFNSDHKPTSERIAAVIRFLAPLFTDVIESHPQVSFLPETEPPLLRIGLQTAKIQFASTVAWDPVAQRYLRADVIDSRVEKFWLELAGLPNNAHEKQYDFQYGFAEEVALAYANWLGWAVALLRHHAQGASSATDA